MKVYVERLPVNCDKCPFHSRILLFAENHIENAVYKTDCRLGFTCKCGLQSLADYTKQVRKEVLDKLSIFLIATFSKDAEFSVEEILNWFQEVKNQIQGVEDGKINNEK